MIWVTDALYSVGVMASSVLLMEFSFAWAGELLLWWRSANGMQEPSLPSYRAEDDMNWMAVVLYKACGLKFHDAFIFTVW